jgi:hypothetical protein
MRFKNRKLHVAFLVLVLLTQSVNSTASQIDQDCTFFSPTYLARLAGVRHAEWELQEVRKIKNGNRLLIGYRWGSLPKQSIYADLLDPQPISVTLTLPKNILPKRTQLGGKLAIQKASSLSRTSFENEVMNHEETVRLFARLTGALLWGHKKQLRQCLKALLEEPEWQRWENKVWVTSRFKLLMQRQGENLVITVEPLAGNLRLYPSVLSPVTLWGVAMSDPELKWVSELQDSINTGPPYSGRKPILLYRMMLHPSWFLRLPRQIVDFAVFSAFSPQIILWDWLRGAGIRRNYPLYRDGILGYWLVYLLAESLFYTPMSSAYSRTHDPVQAWTDPDTISDSYASDAQHSFKTTGVTVYWNGMDKEDFYDAIGYHTTRLTHGIRGRQFNTVYVAFGAPDPDDWGDYHRIYLRRHFWSQIPSGPLPASSTQLLDREQAAASRLSDISYATIYVHKTAPEIRYIFTPRIEETKWEEFYSPEVFKFILTLSKTLGCSQQDAQCGIQNVVTLSHGSPGRLQNIVDWTTGFGDTSQVIAQCEGAKHCRGLPLPGYNNLDIGKYKIVQIFSPGVQFVFTACRLAAESGERDMVRLAEHFQLPHLKGRLLASKQMVVISPLSAFFSSSDPQWRPISNSRNHWTIPEVWEGYFRYGFGRTQQIFDRLSSGSDLWKAVFRGTHPGDILDLDYRNGPEVPLAEPVPPAKDTWRSSPRFGF